MKRDCDNPNIQVYEIEYELTPTQERTLACLKLNWQLRRFKQDSTPIWVLQLGPIRVKGYTLGDVTREALKHEGRAK